jgi:hypothetical protein
MPSELSLSDIKTILKRIKYVSDVEEWDTKPENSAFQVTRSVVLDEDKAAIPGLTFFSTIKLANGKTEDMYKFTIFQLIGQNKRRLFSLETGPEYKRTHKGKTKERDIYGTHIHLGDKAFIGSDAIVKSIKSTLGAEDFEGWLRRFQRHATLSFEQPLRMPIGLVSDLFE